MKRILIIGACGQIGTELTLALRAQLSTEEVIAADIRSPSALIAEGPFEKLDAEDTSLLRKLIKKYEIDTIYHLAALLSAKGEQNPTYTWQLNVNTMLHVLEIVREMKLGQLFFPSSIAVFGPSAPKVQAPQQCYMNPSTIYGISKVAGEQLCAYYRYKYRVDVRSLRYPGLISAKQAPGGGTTDYAVEMFKASISEQSYSCYLEADTRLPMMYIEDAISGTIQLMQAAASRISVQDSYNFAALSFSPQELSEAIQIYKPDFRVNYRPDYREDIAKSWPQSIDDSAACRDWNWKPSYDLAQLVKSMLSTLSATEKPTHHTH